jgi:hypothetical protein
MKRIYLMAVFAFCVGGLTAQTRTTTKSKSQSSTQNSKAASTARKTNTSAGSQQVNVRDRINQRLRDSAAANRTTSNTTVINGITVPAGTTNTNTNTRM